jgi:hypothetical protein
VAGSSGPGCRLRPWPVIECQKRGRIGADQSGWNAALIMRSCSILIHLSLVVYSVRLKLERTRVGQTKRGAVCRISGPTAPLPSTGSCARRRTLFCNTRCSSLFGYRAITYNGSMTLCDPVEWSDFAHVAELFVSRRAGSPRSLLGFCLRSVSTAVYTNIPGLLGG